MATLDHASLAVSDIDQGIGFFAKLLGSEVRFVERGMTGQIASMLGRPEASCDLVQLSLPGTAVRLELIAFAAAGGGEAAEAPVAPGMGHVAVRVDDFDACLARAEALGATRLGVVTRFEDGRSVYLRTPFGAFVEIEEALSESAT